MSLVRKLQCGGKVPWKFRMSLGICYNISGKGGKKRLYSFGFGCGKIFLISRMLYLALNKRCNSSVRNISWCQRKNILSLICYRKPYSHPHAKPCALALSGRCRTGVIPSSPPILILSWWRSWQEISPAQTGRVSIGGGNQMSALGSTLSWTVVTSMAAEASQSVEQMPEILEVHPLCALPDNIISAQEPETGPRLYWHKLIYC